MSATATHTKESILRTLNSELTREARKEYLRELVSTPECPTMLIEIAESWRQDLLGANFDILKQNERKRIYNCHIDALHAYPSQMFKTHERIRADAKVIVDIETTTTAKQLAFERSRQYAEETYILLGEVLAEFEAENQARKMAP